MVTEGTVLFHFDTMDNLEVASSVLQQFAFDTQRPSPASNLSAFQQACTSFRRALKSERLKDQVKSLLSDLIPALFLVTDRAEVRDR